MSGADSSDCQQVSWVNTQGNWGSGAGQIPTGTTLILIGDCAAMNIFANNTTLSLAQGGFTTTDYTPINIYTGVYGLVINGYNTNGASTAFGYIQCSANGSALANQAKAQGVSLGSSCGNITIENLRIQNLYVHTSLSDDQPGPDQEYGIVCPSAGGSNWISGIYFSNMGDGVSLIGNNFTTVVNCQFYNVNHPIYPSTTPGATTNWVINCAWGSSSNWDTTDNAFHNSAIFLDCASGQIAEFRVIGGWFAGDLGYNNSAWIEWQGNPPLYGLMALNFFWVPPGEYLNNGCITMNGQGMSFLNNTLVGGGTCPGLVTTGNGIIMGNNIFINCGQSVNFEGAFSGNTIFNNFFGNPTSFDGADPWEIDGTQYTSLASFDSAAGATGEQYAASTLTLVNTNTGVLPAGSAAIGAGNTAATIDGVVGWPPGGPIDIGENRYFVPGENYGAQFTHP
jgi:hypothetical protein